MRAVLALVEDAVDAADAGVEGGGSQELWRNWLVVLFGRRHFGRLKEAGWTDALDHSVLCSRLFVRLALCRLKIRWIRGDLPLAP